MNIRIVDLPEVAIIGKEGLCTEENRYFFIELDNFQLNKIAALQPWQAIV